MLDVFKNRSRLEKWLLVVIVAIVILHIFGQALHYFVPATHDVFLIRLFVMHFNLDHEVNFVTWFASMLWFTCAALAFIIARHSKGKVRWAWNLITLTALAVSIDEFVQGHEVTLQRIHVAADLDSPTSLVSSAWFVVMPVIAVGGLAAFWFLWRTLPRRTVKHMVTAAVIFLAGALGVEVISSYATDLTFLKNGLLVAAEEGLEKLGTLVLLGAMLDYARLTWPRLSSEIFSVR